MRLDTSTWSMRKPRKLKQCCPFGHPYTKANTYVRGKYRHCRTCRDKRYREKADREGVQRRVIGGRTKKRKTSGTT